jgi:hypothetical protein
MNEKQITIRDEQLTQLEAMHQASDISYEEIINGAINEYFKSFMGHLKRLENVKIVKREE